MTSCFLPEGRTRKPSSPYETLAGHALVAPIRMHGPSFVEAGTTHAGLDDDTVVRSDDRIPRPRGYPGVDLL